MFNYFIKDSFIGDILLISNHFDEIVEINILSNFNKQQLLESLKNNSNYQIAKSPTIEDYADKIEKYLSGKDMSAISTIKYNLGNISHYSKKILDYLANTKMGDTKYYSEIAKDTGNPKAARAVGNICANNKLAIIIPCHRVINKSGDIGNYRWGHEIKKYLLDLEKTKTNKQNAKSKFN